jgi:GT2 family glycosyltransferase
MDTTRAPAGRVAVVIAAYDTGRWPDTVAAVRSVQAQSRPADEIILVIDHNPDLVEQARGYFPTVQVIANKRARGASGARNTGVARTSADLLAFLDDDAVAEPQWLEELLTVLDRPDVVGVGGRLLPLWPVARPAWFPEEFFWVIGASYRGMPEQVAPVRNVWSGSMALRRSDFEAVEGFREGFGKTGNRSRPEDTDLCLRVAEAAPGRTWMYAPGAVAGHKVPPVRATANFFFSRCWHEGRGKAELANATGPEALTAERAYTRTILTRGMRDGVREAMRTGDLAALSQSVAIAGGLGAAAAGMVAGRVLLSTDAIKVRARKKPVDAHPG